MGVVSPGIVSDEVVSLEEDLTGLVSLGVLSTGVEEVVPIGVLSAGVDEVVLCGVVEERVSCGVVDASEDSLDEVT